MRALVTGGGGFLGRAIVELLRARGDLVRCFARGHYRDLEKLGVECVRGDLRGATATRAELASLSGEAFELEDELRIVARLFRERKPMVTPLEGKKAVVMCNEAERSMLEGREISFNFS